MRIHVLPGLVAVVVACAGGSVGTPPASTPAPAPAPTTRQPAAPAPAATTVMQQAAQAEPPKPRDIDPSGSYGVSLTYGGQPIDITLQLWKNEDGSLGGSVAAEGIPTIPLNSVAVSGKKVTATLTSPDGAAVSMEFTIDGVDLSGSWRSSAGDGSTMSGKKIP
jgi:hypothetical protein